jgi:hypothetical protein
MKYLSLVLLFFFCSFRPPGNLTHEVINKAYKRYHGRWHKTLHFIQETEQYRNDSLIKKETWYETIVYPGLFRIDFGLPPKGNAVLFARDSAFVFKEGKLAKVKEDHMDLIFLLGGMYFAPSADDIPKRLEQMGYDPGKGCVVRRNGQRIYIIGTDDTAAQSNSLWLDSNFNLVRFITHEEGKKEEGIFEDHIPTGGGWTETKVRFYVNDHLIQVEKYHDCEANDSIDRRMFVPEMFGKYHWYRN